MDRAKLVAAVAGLVALAVVGVSLYSRDGGERQAAPAAARVPNPPPAAGPLASASPLALGTEPGSITGSVRDAITGDGVVGIEVRLRGAVERTAVSGALGAFDLEVPPGRYALSARGPSHVSVEDGTLSVASGAAVRDAVVRVVLVAGVAGVVVDGDGSPLPDVRVTCSASLSGVPVTGGHDRCAAVSGPDGAFSISVPPGRVALSARVAKRPEATVVLLWVSPGAELTGVELVVDHPAAVAGVVRDRGGAPVASADVVGSVGGVRLGAATSGADGRFRIDGLRSATVWLEAHAHGYGPSRPVAVDLTAGVAQTDVSIVLAADARVAGRVLDPDGNPVPGASVEVARPASSLATRTATTGPDGAFAVDGIARGPVDVVARATGFAPGRRANVAAPIAGVELVLQRAGGVSGLVRANAAAVAQFSVQLSNHVPTGSGPVAPPHPPMQFATTDGAYRIDGVDPGRYDISVAARGFAPELLLGVNVPPGAVANGSANLAEGASIVGTVTNGRSHRPVAGAFVQLSTGHSGELAYTGATGTYRIDDIAPGRRSVVFRRPGFVGHIESGVDLHTGDNRVVDATLRPVESSTLPAGGEPIEFAGIGAALRWQRDELVVSQVIPRGPADIARLQAGDIIDEIDGVPTRGRGIGAAIEDIRGVVGTAVRLRLLRAGEPFAVDIVRAAIQFDGGE